MNYYSHYPNPSVTTIIIPVLFYTEKVYMVLAIRNKKHNAEGITISSLEL